jgi:isopentenyldiphosphate isomerase
VIREAGEELGLNDIQMQLGPKQYVDSSAKCFVQWYTATLDLPIDAFTIQGEEVEGIAWMSLDQLKQELDDNPEKYIPSIKDAVRLFA